MSYLGHQKMSLPHKSLCLQLLNWAISFKGGDLLVSSSLSTAKEYTRLLDTEGEALYPNFKDVSTGKIKCFISFIIK